LIARARAPRTGWIRQMYRDYAVGRLRTYWRADASLIRLRDESERSRDDEGQAGIPFAIDGAGDLHA